MIKKPKTVTLQSKDLFWIYKFLSDVPHLQRFQINEISRPLRVIETESVDEYKKFHQSAHVHGQGYINKLIKIFYYSIIYDMLLSRKKEIWPWQVL